MLIKCFDHYKEREEYLDYKEKNHQLFLNDNRRARIRAAFGAEVGLSIKVSVLKIIQCEWIL